MTDTENFLRYASPNEQRTITRENLGLYHALVIGAVYEFDSDVDVDALDTFFHPLRCCIDEHPYLSVVVGDMHKDKSFYQRTPTINLEDHISILDRHNTDNDLQRIKEVLTANMDVPFSEGIPPWRIVVVRLKRGCFVAFCYSHAIGDGLTGKAFHRTLLEAFQTSKNARGPTVRAFDTPTRPLPAPFDTTERLPISWGFLLSPLLSLILPSFLSTYIGLRKSGSTIDAGTWTGLDIPDAHDLDLFHSNIKLREIEAIAFENVLRTARKHGAKLTGVFEEAISRALSRLLPDRSITNFVAQTAVNMRKSIGVPDDEGGEYASGCYITHPRRDPSESFSDDSWETARSSTRKLAKSAVALEDQVIGLLRYLPSMRKWTISKFGQRRDCSFEVSNIGAFEPRNQISSIDSRVKITRMIFAQPGQIASAPMSFNLVSVKGGSLMYTVSWKAGCLGDVGMEEELFIDTICVSIEQDLEALSR